MELASFLSTYNVLGYHPLASAISFTPGAKPPAPAKTNPLTTSHFSNNPAYVQMASQGHRSQTSQELSLETLVINAEFPANHRTLSSILNKLLQNNSEHYPNAEIKNIFQKIKDDINISIIDTNALNAFADKASNTIYISKGLINTVLKKHEYSNSANHELAFIIGHELSHLVYDQYIKKQNTNNVMSQTEEYFCDRLSLELCDNADFDIKYAKFDTITYKDQISIGFLSSHPHSFDRDFILKELRQSNYWKNIETLKPQRISPLQEYEAGRKSPLDQLLRSPASLNSGQNQEEILLNTSRLLFYTQKDDSEEKFQTGLKTIIQNSSLEDCEKQIYLKYLSKLHPRHKETDTETVKIDIHQLSTAALNLPQLPEYLQVLNAIHDNSAAVSCLNQCFQNIYSNIEWAIRCVDITSDKESEKLLELSQNSSLPIRFKPHNDGFIRDKLTDNHIIKLLIEDLNPLKTTPFPQIDYSGLNIKQQNAIKKQFQIDSNFRELVLQSESHSLFKYVIKDISLKDILNRSYAKPLLSYICKLAILE